MKRFLEWVGIKERIDSSTHKAPLVSERDLWWANIGENVGSEINGKGNLFTRPVLILKKLKYDFYLVAPCTTQQHEGEWYVHVKVGDVDNYICLHQIKSIDHRRLHRRLGKVTKEDFYRVKAGFNNLYK
ncbi:MAG: hypothetical protein JWN64_760 [Parcubacteria group bacterium]|nr:hypothetical protein [Parcubacteria group bacterium]